MADAEFGKTTVVAPTFGQKMRALFCCGEYDEEYDESPRRSMQISGPTDFRRQDVNIAGLTEEEAAEIREKSRRDAQRMFHNLQPLQSSPSGNFAERPPHAMNAIPSYEQFTQPRAAPTPGSSPLSPTSPQFGTNPRQPPSPGAMARGNANRVSGFYGSDNIHASTTRSASGTLGDRVKAHSRKISDSFRKSGLPTQQGHSPPGYYGHTDSQVEMRHLMGSTNASSKTHLSTSIRGGADGKVSDDSFSQMSDDDRYQRFDSGLGSKGGDYRI
ncbi:hypothetical protein Slin15195_G102810 [Septoria linicola]|uniref:Uncharacterized protein n=1 Tax=Septoria linicola TaxID=215465 RepID=A0A9Q9AW21_9PEZI|nr:hypothetical protein Slin14017_G065810 [Septoria linicola]USW56962.1 hypothetical protein Slin15195_G102810 [Septoria linicola]